MTRPALEPVPIADAMIRLGQLLKLAGVAEDGASARLLLGEDAVRVNGEPESRRGRQLVVGDEVDLDLPTGARRLQVTSQS
ncbi:RNA-binding S4 domain-containing protein [Ruania halotolerans]|uniref:RNA-binding S4 domain-containing protein n=1 Tax=Ruania halotolerans TaxID=2897773 RepID=UPI001E3D3F51|nr:RNA-binding S4 domain-containing protein [Ruania halotolerans]UFU05108.1 RNA-binding S4 domain-containing protein [Ruania halotolerans]